MLRVMRPNSFIELETHINLSVLRTSDNLTANVTSNSAEQK
jgi:hypothetical protein